MSPPGAGGVRRGAHFVAQGVDEHLYALSFPLSRAVSHCCDNSWSGIRGRLAGRRWHRDQVTMGGTDVARPDVVAWLAVLGAVPGPTADGQLERPALRSAGRLP